MNIIGRRLSQGKLSGLVRSAIRTMTTGTDTFMTGTSIGYIEKMYDSWKEDPKSVHVSWNAYFTNLAKGISPAFVQPPTLGMAPGSLSSFTAPTGLTTGASAKDIEDHMKVFQLIKAYQLKGHELADLDPLSNTKHNELIFNRARHRIQTVEHERS